MMRSKWIGLVFLGILPMLVPLTGCSMVSGGPATKEDVEFFENQCRNFLAGMTTGADFEATARPPWLLEAKRRGYSKEDGSLQISGQVTLHGATDYSGTEVAVLVAYGEAYTPYVVVSPLVVTTKSDGSFDLVTQSITALNVKMRQLRTANVVEGVVETRDGEKIAYSFKSSRLTPPRISLLIRHPGYAPCMAGVTLVNNDEAILRGEQKWVFSSLEMLPLRQFDECWKAFSLKTNEIKPTWSSLVVSRGNPGTALQPGKLSLHLREHPDCPLADDALFRFLAYHHEMDRMYEPSAPDKEELSEGMDLFYSRFLNARDNTGLLMEQSGTLDGTWRDAFLAIEARFFSREYYRDCSAEFLANAVRSNPRHISFVPLYYFVPDYPHNDAKAQEWERLPDADVTSLVYRAILDPKNWPFSVMAIQKYKDRRAVPVLCRILEWRANDAYLRTSDGSLAVDNDGHMILDPMIASIVREGGLLQTITGLKLEGMDVWLAWWKTSGSQKAWPSLPKDDFRANWLDDLLASRYPKQ